MSSSAPENLLDRVERGVDIADEPRIVARALALDQRGHIKPRRIERLQDVVARGGEEPRLGDVGFFGVRFGAGEFGVEARQFGVRSRTRRSSASAASTLGVMSVKVVTMPPSGHPVGAHLDHEPAFGKALEERLGRTDVAREPFAARGRRRRRRRTCRASAWKRRISSRRTPMPTISRGRSRISPNCRFQQMSCMLLVEHGDALPHMLERGLQDFAVVVDRRVGVVEQLERGLGRDRALAQQQRQHEPRRRRADRGGEQMLGVPQQLEIGFARGSS